MQDTTQNPSNQQPNKFVHPLFIGASRLFGLLALAAGVCLCIFGIKIFQERRNAPLFTPVNDAWISALDSNSTPSADLLPQTATPTAKIVYGFVPYWTTKDVVVHPELTHVGYFGLPIDKNGEFITDEGDGAMGWRTYNASSGEQLRDSILSQGKRFEILITMMEADDIESFLLNKQAQQTFFEQVKTLIKSQPIDGINIDIEYVGTVTNQNRTAYTEFIRDLSHEVKRLSPNLHLSIDVFADSALKERIWDIPSVAPYLDHIIIMTYDFYRSSSPQAGPVAPIFGSENNRWDIDIVKTLKPFLDQVPSEKLLLGIPFYGYEWQTVGTEQNANTYPNTGRVATYKRMQTLMEERDVNEQWDRDALSPYLTYTLGAKNYTAYFENSRSLSYKLDLVNELNMGGIAIWALGYEGNAPELWTVIRQKFTHLY